MAGDVPYGGGGPATPGGLRRRFTLLGVGVVLGAGLIQYLAFLTIRADRAAGDVARVAVGGLAAAAFGAVAFWMVARASIRPLEDLAEVASIMAGGDVSQPIPHQDGTGVIGGLARSLSGLSALLHGTVVELHEAAARLEREAGDIVGGVSRQSTMATQQAAAISQTGTTASEIAQTAKQATEHADSVIQMTKRSEELSHEGLEVVEEAVKASGALGEQVKRIAATMSDLSERTLQVGEIIASVKDLAEQSNLLALNASIEASKAGEHGRGFAVVAMEMRNLAEQSKQAAVQIRSILGEIQKGAREAAATTDEGSKRATSAMALSRSAGEAIEGLAMVIRDSALAARQIANNTRQQTIGVEQMVAAISELSQTINESAESSRTMERGAGALTGISRRLGDAVARFRV